MKPITYKISGWLIIVIFLLASFYTIYTLPSRGRDFSSIFNFVDITIFLLPIIMGLLYLGVGYKERINKVTNASIILFFSALFFLILLLLGALYEEVSGNTIFPESALTLVLGGIGTVLISLSFILILIGYFIGSSSNK